MSSDTKSLHATCTTEISCKWIQSTSILPPHPTHATQRAQPWTKHLTKRAPINRAHWQRYQIWNFWKWAEIKLADSNAAQSSMETPALCPEAMSRGSLQRAAGQDKPCFDLTAGCFCTVERNTTISHMCVKLRPQRPFQSLYLQIHLQARNRMQHLEFCWHISWETPSNSALCWRQGMSAHCSVSSLVTVITVCSDTQRKPRILFFPESISNSSEPHLVPYSLRKAALLSLQLLCRIRSCSTPVPKGKRNCSKVMEQLFP